VLISINSQDFNDIVQHIIFYLENNIQQDLLATVGQALNFFPKLTYFFIHNFRAPIASL
jgi:hypothetical protein